MLGLKDIERLGWLKNYIREKDGKELVDKMVEQSFKVDSVDEFDDDVRNAIARADKHMLETNEDYVGEFVGRI